MGAYLSQPITKKENSVEEDDNFWVASTSMQGWRVSQEDAHNAILQYDDYSSLFAVYDGHGGHEVAAYTAKKLPNYIKCRKDYRMGRIENGLIEAFLGFDRTLTERDVVRELRIIAGKEVDPNEEVDHEEVDNMLQEATMPIEAVMAQNGSSSSDSSSTGAVLDSSSTSMSSSNSDKTKEEPEPTEPTESESGSSNSSSSLKTAVTHFKTRNGGKNKPISPFLRAKQENDKNSVKSENDAATTLSFKEEDQNDDATRKITTNNGSIDHKSDPDSTTEDNKKPLNSNGHHEIKSEGEVHINGDANNGVNQSNDSTIDIKGKGKGKGKGKSSQIVKSKPDTEDKASKEQAPPSPIPAVKSPKKPAKSAAELYQNLVSDDVMDEESSEDDEDDAFAGNDSDSDSDEGDEEDEGVDSDDTELDSSDDDDDDDDSEEFIGGEFNEEPGNDSGCTAVVALLVGKQLFVANAGDSRCVVCRNGKAIEMSFDHKPEDDPERDRIQKAGGRVTPDGRVNGGLNLSRAIGDHAYKTNKKLPLSEQMISPVPDVRKLTIDPSTDSFIFLACDGIWNSLNSQEVVDFINEKLEKNKDDDTKKDTEKLTNILEQLFDHCLAPDTMGDGTGCDNMTAVIAKLKPNAFKSEGKVDTSKSDKIESKSTEVQNNESETATAVASIKRPMSEDEKKEAAEKEPEAKKVKTDTDKSPVATMTKED